MRTSQTLLIAAFLGATSIFGSSTLAQQDQSQSSGGDPVAEAARRAREQKKNAPKPKRVLTEDDIAAKPSEPAPPAASTVPTESAAPGSAAPSADQAADGGEKKDAPNSEGYWHKRFAAQRRKIADVQLELDVLRREVEKADVQYYADPQKAMKEQYSRADINAKNEKIEAKKKDLAALNQELSDMQDELRRSGGDPGWAR